MILETHTGVWGGQAGGGAMCKVKFREAIKIIEIPLENQWFLMAAVQDNYEIHWKSMILEAHSPHGAAGAQRSRVSFD